MIGRRSPLSRLLALQRLLLPFVLREIREQYAGSRLGLVWTVLQPALMVLLYWLVFARILQVRLPASFGSSAPFLVFLLAGLLPWFAFNEGVSRATNAVLAKRNVVTHMRFPLALFPVAAVLAAFLTHLVGYVLFLCGFFLWAGEVSMVQLSGLAVMLFFQVVLTVGIGLAVSSLAVFIRDLVQAIGIILMVLFYTAPILYPLSFVPEELRVLVNLNPFSAFAVSYHQLVLLGQWPGLSPLLVCGGTSLGAFWLGRTLFRRLQPGFADVL